MTQPILVQLVKFLISIAEAPIAGDVEVVALHGWDGPHFSEDRVVCLWGAPNRVYLVVF